MRLTANQIGAIKDLTAECFGDGAVVYLFGSRADDEKRGGDIDLFIETDERDIASALDAKYEFLAKLKRRIGDQRIDVLVSLPGLRRPRPIVEIARRTGIRL